MGFNIIEFLSPGGHKKEIRVKILQSLKKTSTYLGQDVCEIDSDLATSIKFVSFQAKCEPGQVLAKVWKIFKNVKSIMLSKLRPNQKTGEKNNGVTPAGSFFGSDDSKHAWSLIEKRRLKCGDTIIEKVGKIRCLF